MTVVKICGLTTLEDALAALEAGADMLGFNFYPQSPRFITPEACARIVRSLPKDVRPRTLVGVFVNASADQIAATLETCGLHLAQLSGNEPPETLRALGDRAFKALRPTNRAALEQALLQYPACPLPPAYLLDACVKDRYGGTGAMADWSLARVVARWAPILLAGGLKPENVAAAVQQVRPWGVDVASGVESAPGRKDPQKMLAFVQAARQEIPTVSIQIAPAIPSDAAEILNLQKLAYRSEAALYDDPDLPPLTQTQAELEAEFMRWSFLKAIAEDGRIVGSVRACLEDDTCYIARLFVHPDYQNQGIGSLLLEAIERQFAQAARYELFTGEKSARNLYLYQKLGYRVIRREKQSDRVNLLYLEKRKR